VTLSVPIKFTRLVIQQHGFIERFIHLIHIAVLKFKIHVQHVNNLLDYFQLKTTPRLLHIWFKYRGKKFNPFLPIISAEMMTK